MASADTRFQFANIVVKSGIPLPELLPAFGAQPATLRILPPRSPSGGLPPRQSTHAFPDPTGATTVTASRHGEWLVFEFPHLAEFQISPAGEVTYQADLACTAETIRHLLLDQVIPRFLADRGQLVLHGAAIAMAGGGTILLLGESGYGKSTLSAAFAQAGHSVLTDDCVVVAAIDGGVTAYPSYPGFRLWPDSMRAMFEPSAVSSTPMAHYTEKQRLGSAPVSIHGNDVGVRGVFILQRTPSDEDIAMTALSPADACMALLRNAFQSDPGDVAAVGRLLAACAAVSSQSRVASLAYVRRYELLPAVVDAVVARIEPDAPTAT